MGDKLIFGKVRVPEGGSVSIHDIRQLAGVVLNEARHFGRGSYFERKVLEHYFAEALSSNFGYLIENHQSKLEPYKTIYDRITTTRPELKNAMRYYGYSVYGDATITLTVLDDLLFLVYERMRPWKLSAV